MPTPANNNGTLSAFANEGLYSATKNFMFFRTTSQSIFMLF